MTIIPYGLKADLRELSNLLDLEKTRTGFIGSCPVCGYKSGFCLTEKQGTLLAHCIVNECSFKQIIEAIRNLKTYPANPANPARVHQQGFNYKPLDVKDSYNNQAFIHSLWSQSIPAQGSLVETYLRSRGIVSAIPSTIRLLVEHSHTPTGLTLPVMLAKVDSLDNQLIGVHRTYLDPHGERKASVNPQKMMLGSCGRGALHLSEPKTILALAEGIETALSVQQMTGIPTWATLSAGGMKSLVVPSSIEEVFIFADHDQVGMEAAYEKASYLADAGRKTSVIKTPKVNTDFNDFLLEEK